MLETLCALKEKYHANGIKFSFEDEGLTGEFGQIISSVCNLADVHTTIKIGGCEAKKDIHEARVLGANKIVAPMIESSYALKKFVEAAHSIIPEEEIGHINLCINIETITGYNALEEMLQLDEAKCIDYIIFGRSDFVGSLKKDKSFVNSDEMSECALRIAELCGKYGKKLFIGGNVTAQSAAFFKILPEQVLAGVETRNVIFDRSLLDGDGVTEAVNLAMHFEIQWLEYKAKFYKNMIANDEKRICALQKRM